MVELQFFLYDEPITPTHGLMVSNIVEQLQKFGPDAQIVNAEWEIDTPHNRKTLKLDIR